MQSTVVKKQLREATWHLRHASNYLKSIRETNPDFVDDIHPSILTLAENCEAEIQKIHDYPEGQAYKVTSIFTEEVFARSAAEAEDLHLQLLSQWGREGNLGNSMQDVEEVEATEAECFISFKEPAHA